MHDVVVTESEMDTDSSCYLQAAKSTKPAPPPRPAKAPAAAVKQNAGDVKKEGSKSAPTKAAVKPKKAVAGKAGGRDIRSMFGKR